MNLFLKKRRLFILSVMVFATVTMVSGCKSDPPSPVPESQPNVVETSNGPVRGLDEDGIHIFKGVRYAAPPVGDLRFKPPRSARTLERTRECL